MDMSTLWDITPTNERYLTFIDYINSEQDTTTTREIL